MAQSYPQLVLARISVGIGEAGGVPPSYSIITDYFPPERRGMALGIFNLGPPLGQAFGVAFSAKIAAMIVAASVREPGRGATDISPAPVRDVAAETITFWRTVRMFASRPTLLLVSLAGGMTQFLTYSTLGFMTLFLMREKGMTLDEVAL